MLGLSDERGLAFELGAHYSELEDAILEEIANGEFADDERLFDVAAAMFNVLLAGYRSFPNQIDAARLAHARELDQIGRNMIREWLGSEQHQTIFEEMLDQDPESIRPKPAQTRPAQSASTVESKALESIRLHAAQREWLLHAIDFLPPCELTSEWWRLLRHVLEDLGTSELRKYFAIGQRQYGLRRDLERWPPELLRDQVATFLHFLIAEPAAVEPGVVAAYDTNTCNLAELIDTTVQALSTRIGLQGVRSLAPRYRRPYLEIDRRSAVVTFLGRDVPSLLKRHVDVLATLTEAAGGEWCDISEFEKVVTVEEPALQNYFSDIRQALQAALETLPMSDADRRDFKRWTTRLGSKRHGKSVFRKADAGDIRID